MINTGKFCPSLFRPIHWLALLFVLGLSLSAHSADEPGDSDNFTESELERIIGIMQSSTPSNQDLVADLENAAGLTPDLPPNFITKNIASFLNVTDEDARRSLLAIPVLNRASRDSFQNSSPPQLLLARKLHGRRAAQNALNRKRNLRALVTRYWTKDRYQDIRRITASVYLKGQQ